MGAIVIRIGDDGSPVVEPVIPEAIYQAWPDWLEIAVEEFSRVKVARTAIVAAISTGEQDAENEALKAEFLASMQCITACAFALDAFYTRIAEFAPISDAERARRLSQRTARSAWVFDAIRRCTQMANGEAKAICAGIRAVFQTRDRAVHPSFKQAPFVLHPGAHIGVPDMVAIFCLENSSNALAVSVEAIARVADMPRAGIPGLDEVARSASAMLHPIIEGTVTMPDGWPTRTPS